MDNRLRPDFLIIPYQLISDENLQPTDRLVYAVIYWYTRLKLERCIASNRTIADMVNIKAVETVQASLKRLEDNHYIKRVLDKENNRNEIIPLIGYGKTDDSDTPPLNNGAPTVKQSGTPPLNDGYIYNINNNNSKKEIVTTLQQPKAAIAKEDKRNPDIQEVYEYGLSKGFVGIKQQYQRYAIKRLLGKIEKNKLLRLVDFTQQIRKDQYAPQVNTFLDMEYKLANLRDYMARKQTKQKTIVKI